MNRIRSGVLLTREFVEQLAVFINVLINEALSTFTASLIYRDISVSVGHGLVMVHTSSSNIIVVQSLASEDSQSLHPYLRLLHPSRRLVDGLEFGRLQ